jgi:hypothetical protein
MLNHALVTTIDASAAVAERRASLGAATKTSPPAATTSAAHNTTPMLAAMAVGGLLGGFAGFKLAGMLGALALGGAGVYAGHRFEASRATGSKSESLSFSRADYVEAIDALSVRPDFQQSLDPTGMLTAEQKKPLLDGMRTQSLVLWDSGAPVELAGMAVESYAIAKNVDITSGTSVDPTTLSTLKAALSTMEATLGTAKPYSPETQQIGVKIARMLRFRAAETTTPETKALVTSMIDEAFQKIDGAKVPAVNTDDPVMPPGILSIAPGTLGTSPEFMPPPRSPAEVLARDPRPAWKAGVVGSDLVAERRYARFPAAQKVNSVVPRPLYHPIVGFSGTADAPIPIYSEESWPLEPAVTATVLEGLYSIDGVTYWVGDPATPPGTLSGMFPVESSSAGWSSVGARGGLYLPTQGDLYLIQQALMPTPGVSDPDRAEAFREIQELIEGAGGLRPLGPKSSDPSDPHMPPVLLNVKPASAGSGEEVVFSGTDDFKYG